MARVPPLNKFCENNNYDPSVPDDLAQDVLTAMSKGDWKKIVKYCKNEPLCLRMLFRTMLCENTVCTPLAEKMLKRLYTSDRSLIDAIPEDVKIKAMQAITSKDYGVFVGLFEQHPACGLIVLDIMDRSTPDIRALAKEMKTCIGSWLFVQGCQFENDMLCD